LAVLPTFSQRSQLEANVGPMLNVYWDYRWRFQHRLYDRYNTEAAVKKFADRITSLGCEQLISVPTRVSAIRQSILNLFT